MTSSDSKVLEHLPAKHHLTSEHCPSSTQWRAPTDRWMGVPLFILTTLSSTSSLIQLLLSRTFCTAYCRLPIGTETISYSLHTDSLSMQRLTLLTSCIYTAVFLKTSPPPLFNVSSFTSESSWGLLMKKMLRTASTLCSRSSKVLGNQVTQPGSAYESLHWTVGCLNIFISNMAKRYSEQSGWVRR